jgi:hypothetical protein
LCYIENPGCQGGEMTVYKVKFMMIVLLLCAGHLYAEDTNKMDLLWQNAVKLAGDNRGLIAGRMIVQSVIMDDNGKTNKVNELEIRVNTNKDGYLQPEMTKFIENGKDITEAKKKEINEAKNNHSGNARIGFSMEDMNPFLPGLQSNITIIRITADTDTNISVYDYIRTINNNKVKTQTGRAWLDKITGVPIKIIFTIDPLPPFVTRMTNAVFYKTGKKMEWYPDKMVIEGSGGFLFYKVNMVSITQFDDYKIMTNYKISNQSNE